MDRRVAGPTKPEETYRNKRGLDAGEEETTFRIVELMGVVFNCPVILDNAEHGSKDAAHIAVKT